MPAAVQDIDEAKLRKRIYNREKQRLFQAKLVNQMLSLKDEVVALEAELARLQISKQNEQNELPWKDIAAALREETLQAVHTNKNLKNRHQQQVELIDMLKSWVNIQTRHSTLLSAPARTWRNVTLLASPQSRALGYDWITAHLHHNTQAVFQRYAFPTTFSSEISGDFAMDWSDPDVLQYIWRYQREMDLPLDFVADIFRENVWRSMMLGGFVILHTEELLGMPAQMIYRHTITNPEETVNYLGREYRSEDRVVFVGQNIHDDEILPSGTRQRNRMAWVVLDKLSPLRTLVRILHINSQFFTKEGYVSLEQEAKLWGCDLEGIEGSMKLATFKQHVAMAGNDVARMCRNKFEGACNPSASYSPTCSSRNL